MRKHRWSPLVLHIRVAGEIEQLPVEQTPSETHFVSLVDPMLYNSWQSMDMAKKSMRHEKL